MEAAKSNVFNNAFNRTTLELKPEDRIFFYRGLQPFNRTTLELKRLKLRGKYEPNETFNRTTLELKHASTGGKPCADTFF